MGVNGNLLKKESRGKKMKRLTTMVVMVVMVVVLTNSSAEAQFGYLYNPETYIPHGFGSGFGGHVLGNIFGNYGGYGSTHSTFGKIVVGGSLLNQILVNNKLVDHRISMDNQTIDIVRREQNFRHGQHRIIRGRSNTVLRTTVPVRRIIKIKPKKTQTPKKTQMQENEKLRQEVEKLRLEVERLKLRQEIEKQAKKQ